MCCRGHAVEHGCNRLKSAHYKNQRKIRDLHAGLFFLSYSLTFSTSQEFRFSCVDIGIF